MRDTSKDSKFFAVIEHRFRDLDFVDAWGGSKPTLALLANWGLVTQPGATSFSYTSPEDIPFDLTDKGRHVIQTNDNERQQILLQHALEDGLLGFLQLIYERNRDGEACTRQWIVENWNEKVGLPLGKWSSAFTRGQNVETRRSWANEFRLIRESGRPINFTLTDIGLEVLRKHAGEAYGKFPSMQIEAKKEEYSHSDAISDLLSIGQIVGFDTYRTPSVNEILPAQKMMKQKVKELDCAWRFYHPFTGNIWIPIEVQKGGIIEDSLSRLNIVSEHAHRLVVVCDPKDSETIREFAERMRIPAEKLILFTFDEIIEIKSAIERVKDMKKKLLGE